ncbi:MAG: hypothetical protein KatS3mg061_1124 [Dehalococcoidia bacterium]|nr:MAG: hypothetical protein KatS3mg061_1124 [Dehalococcoidia bacterium]
MSASDLLGLNVSRLEALRERLPALGLKRAELFLFRRDELPAVRQALAEQGVRFSAHVPVPRPEQYPFPPTWTFLNYADAERRDLYFRIVKETVETAAELGAEYVVVHYPGPITPACEAIGRATLREIALASAERLAELSARTGVPLHIEGFGPSPFLTSEFILEVLTRYPHSGLLLRCRS